jgi:hypothetical protein
MRLVWEWRRNGTLNGEKKFRKWDPRENGPIFLSFCRKKLFKTAQNLEFCQSHGISLSPVSLHPFRDSTVIFGPERDFPGFFFGKKVAFCPPGASFP